MWTFELLLPAGAGRFGRQPGRNPPVWRPSAPAGGPAALKGICVSHRWHCTGAPAAAGPGGDGDGRWAEVSARGRGSDGRLVVRK